jgi:hypothetical protein
VSEPLEVLLLLNTIEAENKLDQLKTKTDAVVENWRISRQEVTKGLTILSQSLSLMVRIAERTMGETHQGMLKTIRSLSTMLTAAVSAMYAVASGYAATGILAPIGAALAGFTTGMAIGQQIAINITYEDIGRRMLSIESNMRDVETRARMFYGGGGVSF